MPPGGDTTRMGEDESFLACAPNVCSLHVAVARMPAASRWRNANRRGSAGACGFEGSPSGDDGLVILTVERGILNALHPIHSVIWDVSLLQYDHPTRRGHSYHCPNGHAVG